MCIFVYKSVISYKYSAVIELYGIDLCFDKDTYMPIDLESKSLGLSKYLAYQMIVHVQIIDF